MVSTLLSVQVIARSLRTAALNRRLVQMHTVDGRSPAAQIAAPALDVSPGGQAKALMLALMTMPDGAPIRESAVDAPVSFHKTSGDVLPDMLKLVQTNPDTAGWIGINGIVHLPVVYRDNAYYLTHDFSGRQNTSGALFLDQASPVAAQTQNLLIHGHSMFDGSMFGLLTHYQKPETLARHPLISFSTLYEKETYAVFAVLRVAPDAFDYYSHPTFPSETAFEDYDASVRERSLYDIPVDVRPDDALLTLSTCIDDDLLVVMARRLRNGETRDALISAIEQSRKRSPEKRSQ